MARKRGRPDSVERPAVGGIPESILAAKEAGRERLLLARDPDRARALRRAKRFTAQPDVNLVGVGIGEKETGGRPTGELCVKLFVARKLPESRIPRSALLPRGVEGIPTDVEEVGYPRAQAASTRRKRPVPGGVSISLDARAVTARYAGTLGVILADRRNPRALYALSNNHVLADENRAGPGAVALQPGTLDGGTARDRIGTLASHVPLRFENRRNWMDAAVARLDTRLSAAREILEIGPVRGAGEPTLLGVVRKSGRTTGLTEGVVRAVHADIVDIGYETGMVRMDDVLVIRGTAGSFSAGGDSGSAIVDARGRVVGLLFAGSDLVTYAIPMGRILRRFRMRIAT